MATQDIVETRRREAIQDGAKQGREEGRVEGVKQGVAHALVEVYEARFGVMPDDLRALAEAYSERRKATRSAFSR